MSSPQGGASDARTRRGHREYDRITTQEDFYYRRHQQNKKPP